MASYESFSKNWSDRLRPLVRGGAGSDHLAKLKPIIQQDFLKLQRGEEPMDDAAAISTMLSIVSGKPLLKEPTNPPGIRDMLGNVGKDVAGIATFLNPAKLGPALIDEFEQVGGMIRGDVKVPDQGNPLRQLAATPGVRMIPGLYTLSNLTTPQGRETIKQHPVSTTLDVLPIAGSALKLGAAALNSAGVVDRASVVSKLAQQQVLTEAGRAAAIPPAARLSYPEAIYAAAAEGKPVGTILAASGMKPVLDAALNPVTTWLQTNTQLARAHSVETRIAQGEINEFNKKWNQTWEKMDADERVLLGKEWSQPDLYPTRDPAHRAILDEGRLLQRRFAAQGAASGDLIGINVMGKDFFYSKSSPVAKAITHQAAAEDKLASSIDKLDKINSELATTIDPVRKLQLESQRLQATRLLDRAKSAANKARYDRTLTIYSTAPKEFYPMLKTRLHEEAVGQITGKLDRAEITRPEFDAAMKKFELGDYVQVFGKPAWEKLSSGIEQTWTSLLDAGFDPIFLHNVPSFKSGAATRGKVIATHEFRPGQFQDVRLSDTTPEYSDVAVGLTSGAAEYVNRLSTDRFITDHIIPRGYNYDDALKVAMPQIERLQKKGMNLVEAKDRVLNEMFAKVDNAEEAFGFSSVRAHSNMAGRTLYFDKDTFNAAKKLTAPKTPATAFGRAAEKTNSIFKTSLFGLSIKHLADETLGNTFLLGLTGTRDTFSPSVWREAIDMARTDTLPAKLSRGLDIVSTDELRNTAYGKTLGRVFKGIGGNALTHFNEFMNKVHKSVSYLGEEKHLLRQGVEPELAQELAIRHANDALVDFDSMMPLERTIIRQVFPFYSWTRFLAKFVTKYPIDHPLRASFFSRIADMENTDESSGFPRYFRNLAFMGNQDENGNIRAVDLRVMNPLRDTANLSSWAGFFSAVSPLLEVPLRAAGIDTLAGSPEMFPELTYDPETGKLVARRNSIASKSGVMEMLGQFIPPAQSIDHFFTLTDRLKRLKATDPISYRRQLFSALGIPFIPYQESIPKAQSRQQKALVEAARATVSRSTSKGASTRDLRRYPIVPWNGQLVPGEGLANLIDSLHSISAKTGIPTRMLMDKVAKVVK